MCELSFIIPCYRSENTVGNVINEIKETVRALSIEDYEIIAVDDCSPDDVYGKLISIGAADSRVRAIRFSKRI